MKSALGHLSHRIKKWIHPAKQASKQASKLSTPLTPEQFRAEVQQVLRDELRSLLADPAALHTLLLLGHSERSEGAAFLGYKSHRRLYHLAGPPFCPSSAAPVPQGVPARRIASPNV